MGCQDFVKLYGYKIYSGQSYSLIKRQCIRIFVFIGTPRFFTLSIIKVIRFYVPKLVLNALNNQNKKQGVYQNPLIPSTF